MATHRKRAIWPEALSKQEAAHSLGLSLKVIERAIKEADLVLRYPPYGLKLPRLARTELVEWVSTWPEVSNAN